MDAGSSACEHAREHRRWRAGWEELMGSQDVAEAGAEDVADFLARCGHLAGLLLDFVHAGRLDAPAPQLLTAQVSLPSHPAFSDATGH